MPAHYFSTLAANCSSPLLSRVRCALANQIQFDLWLFHDSRPLFWTWQVERAPVLKFSLRGPARSALFRSIPAVDFQNKCWDPGRGLMTFSLKYLWLFYDSAPCWCIGADGCRIWRIYPVWCLSCELKNQSRRQERYIAAHSVQNQRNASYTDQHSSRMAYRPLYPVQSKQCSSSVRRSTASLPFFWLSKSFSIFKLKYLSNKFLILNL